jgi:ADP-ribosylglycohydrolase
VPTLESSASSASSTSSPIVRSALWAAWGDALGFPAELASPSLLQRRLGGSDAKARPWPRRIGGRMGPTVELPAGCTSDDTQLRLAVGRCLRAAGRFDAEAFSKVELPVFLAYGLGVGRGTREAARGLGRRSTRWFSNFFDTKASRYLDGGGNGAAMRIQPHVWASPSPRPDAYLRTVLRDAVCTHGHTRGILGAALHAVSLGTTLHEGAIPRPDRWAAMVDHLVVVGDLVRNDEVLGERWLPAWEDQSGESFETALQKTVEELQNQVSVASRASMDGHGGDDASIYADLVRELGGFDSRTRGAGTISSVLALWLAWTYSDRADEGIAVAAGLLESDTDTVATMAGAILGAVTDHLPPGPVLDGDLITSEAARFGRMSRGEQVDSFPHPDPMWWETPGSLSDVLGTLDGRPAVAGLGAGDLLGTPFRGEGKQPGIWQWFRTDYGQHLLIKRREELGELSDWARPRVRGAAPDNVRPIAVNRSSRPHAAEPPADPVDGAEVLAAKGFRDTDIGAFLRFYAAQGPTQAAVFATLIATRLQSEASRKHR